MLRLHESSNWPLPRILHNSRFLVHYYRIVLDKTVNMTFSRHFNFGEFRDFKKIARKSVKCRVIWPPGPNSRNYKLVAKISCNKVNKVNQFIDISGMCQNNLTARSQFLSVSTSGTS